MNNLHPIAQAVQSQGRGKDTQLVHMTPDEVAGMQALAKAHGGSLTVNPETGLVEAGFLDSILPTVAGVGLSMMGVPPPIAAGIVGIGTTMLNGGDLGKGLVAGIGAYGGAGIGQGLGFGATTTGTGLVAPTNAATSAFNTGASTNATSGLAGQAGGLNLSGAGGTSLNYGGLSTAPAAAPAATSSAYSIAPATAMPAASAIPAGATGASQYSMSNTPSAMDLMKSKGFFSDNAFNIGAALTPALLDQPDNEDAPVDNEQYQYDFSSNRTSQADLDAQRLANPGGELRYFTPAYSNERRVRVAQGGILGLAEGGAINSSGTPDGAVDPIFGQSASGSDMGIANGGNEFKYTYDPVTKTYKKVIPEGTAVAAPPPPQISQEPNGGGGFDGPAAAPSASTPDISVSGDAGLGGPNSNGASPDGGGMDGGATMAKGGIAGLAAGGMAKGGFVVPADVVSALGNGSTNAGLRALKSKFGAVKHIKGKGDGLSDSIPTSIDGKQPARVADGEAYIDPKTVAKVGGGDAKKGAKKLYAMMDKIRSQAHGKTTQQRKVDSRKVV